MIIYKTTNIINNKIYIGQKSNNRPNYIGGGILIIKAIKDFGRKNFLHEIIIEGTFNKALSNSLEKHYIRLYNSTNRKVGYNIMTGGKSTGRHSKATIKKISLAKIGNTWNKGKTHTEYSKYKIGEGNRNKKISSYQKKIMFEARKKAGFQNIGARKVNKIKVFKILSRKNKYTYKELSTRYNVKYNFINKLFNQTNFYKNWKDEFKQSILENKW